MDTLTTGTFHVVYSGHDHFEVNIPGPSLCWHREQWIAEACAHSRQQQRKRGADHCIFALPEVERDETLRAFMPKRHFA